MAIAELIYPFRWDITQPAQLGRLTQVDLKDQYNGWYVPDFDKNFLGLCVKILACCDNADLYFVGRSPENIYDYLSGLLRDTSWRKRLHLFHFSMYDLNEVQIKKQYPGAIPQLRAYMAHLGLAPWQLVKRKYPVALVDLVSSGGTMGNLVNLILNWGKELQYEPARLAAKIRIVSIIRPDFPIYVGRRLYKSCYRWQKDAPWTALLGKNSIKDIRIGERLWEYLAGIFPRVSHSFYPARWNDEQVNQPDHTGPRIKALQNALSLYNRGLNPAERRRFAREMSREKAMRYRWYRDLLNQLN